MTLRGIVVVAFGKNADEVAAHTVAYSRKFTDLPFCIFSNLPENERALLWKDVVGVEFRYHQAPVDKNRHLKTQLYYHTPYNETLYMDADAVVQKEGVELFFELLGEHRDVVLNHLVTWGEGQRVVRIYKRAMQECGGKLPLSVYNGALICWRETVGARSMFDCWHALWQKTGCGREMPALAIAVQTTQPKIRRCLPGMFSPDVRNTESIIQHNYNSSGGKHWHEEFGIPVRHMCKPFDKAGNHDWEWVGMDDD